MRKILSGTVIAVAATLVLAGCGNAKSKDAKSNNQVQTVKLGVMPSTDNLPLLVAAKEGLDKQNGVKLEIEPFKSARDRDAAFQAGKVDGVISDVIALAIYEQGGMDVKVTSTTHDQFDLVAAGNTTMVDKNGKTIAESGKKIASIHDLKGKKIIIAKNGGIEYATSKMLAAAGMQDSDVQMLDVPPVPTRLELLKAGKASAAVLPEPFITMGKADGQQVIDSTIKIGLNPFIIGFPAKTIAAKKSAIQGFYKAYDQAVDEINSNRSNPKQVAKYRAMLVENVGFPAKLAKTIKIDKFPKASQISDQDINDAFKWAREKGLLQKNLKAKDVLSDVYFK